MSHCQFIGLWGSTHFTCLGKSYTMRLLPFHFSAKRSKLETWNVQIFFALTGTSQQLSPALPIFKDTWPQGGLCDRKTSPPCTRLLSHCEHSPYFASIIWWRFCAHLWPMDLAKSLMSYHFHFAQLWDDWPWEDGEVLEKLSFGLTLGSNHLDKMSVTRFLWQ